MSTARGFRHPAVSDEQLPSSTQAATPPAQTRLPHFSAHEFDVERKSAAARRFTEKRLDSRRRELAMPSDTPRS
jgi:hypothetical protein